MVRKSFFLLSSFLFFYGCQETTSPTSSSDNSNVTTSNSSTSSSPSLSYTGSTGTTGTVGTTMSVFPTSLQAGNGATISRCSTSPSLPNGLTINNKTCEISGIPTDTMISTNYEVSITNSLNKTSSANVYLTILDKNAPLSISVSSPNSTLFVTNTLPNPNGTTKTANTAIGNGGLGLNFDDNNKLIRYFYIPIEIYQNNLDANSPVFLGMDTSGDSNCNSIFSLQLQNNVISINPEFVTSFTSCSLTITAQANFQNQVISSQASIDVNLVPTFNDYANSNHPAFQQLQAASGASSPSDVAYWLTNKTAGQNVLFQSGQDISNFDILAGDTAVKTVGCYSCALNTAKTLSLHSLLSLKGITGIEIQYSNIPDLSEILSLKKLPSLSSLILVHADFMNDNAFQQIAETLPQLTKLVIGDSPNLQHLTKLNNFKKLTFLQIDKTSLKDLNDFQGFTSPLEVLSLQNHPYLITNASDADLLKPLSSSLKSLYIGNSSESYNTETMGDDFVERLLTNLAEKNILKIFSDRNIPFEYYLNTNCSNIHHYFNKESIHPLFSLTNLEQLDLHGNSCSAYAWTPSDNRYSMNQFTLLQKLNSLDISDNYTSDVSFAKALPLLTHLTLVDPNGYALGPVNDLDAIDGFFSADTCRKELPDNLRDSCAGIP